MWRPQVPFSSLWVTDLGLELQRLHELYLLSTVLSIKWVQEDGSVVKCLLYNVSKDQSLDPKHSCKW